MRNFSVDQISEQSPCWFIISSQFGFYLAVQSQQTENSFTMDAHEHNLVHPLSPRDNVSDFFQAVGQRDVDNAARFLRNGWNVQTRNEYGHSAIHDAVKKQ